MEKRIKYLRTITATDAEFSAANPLLLKGETVYVETNGKTTRKKVGPGRYNDLPYFENDIFFNVLVTNPVGDLSGNLEGRTIQNVILDMVAPFIEPVITSPQNNAYDSNYEDSKILEIGRTISGSIGVKYGLNYPQNIKSGTPINITAGGVFNNEGNFAHAGSAINMVLPAALTPTFLSTIKINIKALGSNDQYGPTATTSIKFLPKIIWGVSSQDTINAAGVLALGSKLTTLSATYKNTYAINNVGYAYIAVPTMLIGANPLQFTDVLNPDLPSPVSTEILGTITINNGVGTYPYQIYRSTFYLNDVSLIKVI